MFNRFESIVARFPISFLALIVVGVAVGWRHMPESEEESIAKEADNRVVSREHKKSCAWCQGEILANVSSKVGLDRHGRTTIDRDMARLDLYLLPRRQ